MATSAGEHRSLLDDATDFVLSVAVTHAEIDHYACRLRERCDRVIAVCRS